MQGGQGEFVDPANFWPEAGEEPDGWRATLADMSDDTVIRQITDSWRRIEAWLEHHAPVTHAALGSGATQEEIDAAEAALGIAVPVELRTLWGLVSGGSTGGYGLFLGNAMLIGLDEVAEVYRSKMREQADEEEADIVWNSAWVPVFSSNCHDTVSGTYLNTETGLLWNWTKFAHQPPDDDEQDSVVTYLEKLADYLEYPDMAPDRPGTVEGALAWRSFVGEDESWRPA
ncbi:hypothetical protein Srubr_46590 [Streptomyces rubradiris]|uniref:Knr4/Smi1-like domain-containing protein n=2 Tax=Streptomyces rubradiris TaxID=285531 RepID=A0ABQ3RG29_STRRR|nr:hypothetical protein GCM10018792_53730 [Streptomyces rubradiris]GHI54813.1 hypothetical protein Srubr_46590 [Streptomyces rubradiris]